MTEHLVAHENLVHLWQKREDVHSEAAGSEASEEEGAAGERLSGGLAGLGSSSVGAKSLLLGRLDRLADARRHFSHVPRLTSYFEMRRALLYFSVPSKKLS